MNEEYKWGLLAVGALIIGGVQSYRYWKENRSRQATHAAFSKKQTDVLFQDIPKSAAHTPHPEPEPVSPEKLEEEKARLEQEQLNEIVQLSIPDPEPLPVQAPIEPQKTVAQSEVSAQPVSPTVSVPTPLHLEESVQEVDDNVAVIAAALDSSLDLIASIKFEYPLLPNQLPRLSTTRRVQWLGCTTHGQWQLVYPEKEEYYMEFTVGIQLVDRRGVIAEKELEMIAFELKAFQEAFEGHLTLPPLLDIWRKAQVLDAFCAEVDIQIGLNIVSPKGSVFLGTKVRSLAEAAGMVLEPDGRFYYYSESGSVLFLLENQNQNQGFQSTDLLSMKIQGMTLLLDVPRVAGGPFAFNEMLQIACDLAEGLGGDLVDDNRITLTEAGARQIHQQLETLYTQMDDFGIVPGSVAAQRLFA